MTTINNEPTIRELAHMDIGWDIGSDEVYYRTGLEDAIHKTITWTDISESKEFFLERAKYINLNNEFNFADIMSEELKNDIDFAKQLIPLHPNYVHWFSKDIKKDKEVIKLILKHCEPSQWKPGGHNVKILSKENRLGIAYEIIKEFPEYEILLGATIKKKIGSMTLVEYVEKKSLQKSLRKNLTKDSKPTKRMKI